jgi:hypothetical protein
MGILLTNLVEKKDTNGTFSLLEATLAPGNEPPPMCIRVRMNSSTCLKESSTSMLEKKPST